MNEPALPSLLLTAALSGVVSHQLLFKRVEVDPHPLLIGSSFIAAPFALSRLLSKYTTLYAENSLSTSYLLVGTFLLSLFASIFIYRTLFHPLKNFPGPFSAKISKIWALTQAAKSGLKWYQIDTQLHKKHGDYVRTGPRELSITDPAAIPLILSFSAKTSKGPFYDSMEESVSTTRDRNFHKQRRKVWDSAMKQLLTNYNPQLELFTDTFLSNLHTTTGKPLIINALTLHYSYDVMTQLAFGRAGGFLSHTASATATQVLSGIQSGIDAIGLLNHVPWIMTLLTTFSFLPGPMLAFNTWSNQALLTRKKEGSENPDLMGYLLSATPDDSRGKQLLFSESRVIIGAGSDTTATALSEIFILLAHYPSYVNKIREEMDPIFAEEKFNCQTAYPVLESIIMEVLRLYPPVLFGSQRVTPSEGLQIGTHWIPGDTVVYMPVYQLHHDARNFSEPDAFIPERWTTRSELVVNRAAWMPFMIGPGNCPGRPLAMMELRSVIARTLNEFEVKFPEGVKFNLDFFKGVKDHFVAGVPKIELVFTKREK